MGTGVPVAVPQAGPLAGLRPSRSVGVGLALGRGLLSFGVLFAVWYGLTASGWVKPLSLASPAAVASVLVDGIRDRSLLGHLGISLARMVVSMIVAGTAGIAVGVLVGISRPLAAFVEPLAGFFNALSGIVWLPLAITWFGLTWKTVLFVIGNSIFFIVFFNTLVGIRGVPRLYEQAILTLGASRWLMLRDVLLPGALPGVVTGIRLGMAFGWRALIAAELVAVTQGLGFMIFNAANYLRTDIILAGILVIGVVAVALDSLILVPIERATVLRWGFYQ
jgi:ABC-type nitrate/sulfonate/bicarbonate transport system permease component